MYPFQSRFCSVFIGFFRVMKFKQNKSRNEFPKTSFPHKFFRAGGQNVRNIKKQTVMSVFEKGCKKMCLLTV